MDKVNFNCVVEVFYPVMNELEHQLAAPAAWRPVTCQQTPQQPWTHRSIYIYIQFPRSRLSNAQ